MEIFAEHQHKDFARILVRMHPELHQAIAIAADKAGMSMNQWCVRSLAARAIADSAKAPCTVCNGDGVAVESCEDLGVEVKTTCSCTEDRSPQCPHGNNPAECNDCMVAGDLAHDANREDRFFGGN